jgi:hypothetical protein
VRFFRSLAQLGLFMLAALVFSAPASANHGNADVASSNFFHLGNSKPSTPRINSDLAFWGNLVYAGNYNGFRIIDVRDPRHPPTIRLAPRAGRGSASSMSRTRGSLASSAASPPIADRTPIL